MASDLMRTLRSRMSGTLPGFLLLLVAFGAGSAAAIESRSDGGAQARDFAARLEMAELDDSDLRAEAGQAGSLILTDRIGPNELTGATSANTFANFSYYRMGLDGKLDFNANISKLQLGCGGVNDLLGGVAGTPGCDLDIDYLGFMGLNAAGDRPDPAGAESTFKLTRPFIELAIKNENNPATREVVGVRIGAQNIRGALRMGRDYTGFGNLGNEASMTNVENGGTCVPSATTGSGVIGCHSGINALSGYLAGLELSAGFRARARVCLDLTTICLFGIGEVDMDLDGCIGRINFDPCTTGDTPFFIDAGGTRINNLDVAAAKLKLKTNVIFPITLEGYGELVLNTRQIHYLLAPDSSDFYLSFQRERVSWPRYDKTPPPNNMAYDACNPAYGQVAARCSSAYLPAANTGWWLSATNLKMLNLQPGNRIVIPGTFDVYELLSALGPGSSPIVIDNPKLDFIAADNCRGSALFC
ncbi:MAG: hypothetical protein K0S16_173 [Moraxellaceae bacterium]|nr:hypothetical protein [Moraxellaceae bacterium]